MTLVIACKSKDGIVVASDGYGAEFVPGAGKTGRVVSNSKKIFVFNRACLLTFGDGREDYDEFFKDLIESHKWPLTYKLLLNNLVSYLKMKYGDDIYFTDTIGLVLAGLDEDGRQCINTFLSKTHLGVGFQCLNARYDFLCAGKPNIANELFKNQTNLAYKSVDEIAVLANEAIIETSKVHDDVNDNVVLKLVSNSGISNLVSTSQKTA